MLFFQFGRHTPVELTDYDQFQLAVWIWQSFASLGHKSVVRSVHLLEERESKMKKNSGIDLLLPLTLHVFHLDVTKYKDSYFDPNSQKVKGDCWWFG